MLAFDLAKELIKYMVVRTEARELYHASLTRLEPMRGSPYFVDEQKAAREKRTATVEAAQAAARSATRAIFEEMKANAAKIQTEPPTPEALAILQTLQMRENVTTEELQEAAQAMGGNSLALAVIDDLARKNGRITNYASAMSTKLSRQAAESIIADMQHETEKILADPVGVKPQAQIYANMRAMRYNERIDPDSLPRAQRYADEFELLQDLGVGDFDKFTEAVG